MKLSVVTASVDPGKTEQYWKSWRREARTNYEGIIVLNGVAWHPDKQAELNRVNDDFDLLVVNQEILGTVPAFLQGIEHASGDVIAALHDDVTLLTPGWDEAVLAWFDRHPRCGLLSFSGCDGLGADRIYQEPYNPMQLARQGFFSNMTDAEAHGRREVVPARSACGDGFSQVGRAEFMLRAYRHFNELGVKHHAFDSWLGALAAASCLEVWFLPIKCGHAGGVTAVGSEAYQKWAAPQGGDQAFWNQAHAAMYEDCRGVLPIRVR